MADDWGLKVTQLGFDVGVSADQNLLFSSAWPLPKITHVDDAVFTDDVTTTIYNHNLGYPPLYFPFKKDGDKLYFFNDPSFYVDNNTFGFAGVGAGVTHDIRFFICRNPLNQNFTAAVTNTDTQVQGEIDHDWGFKATKEGKDITSTDLRDYTIHSSTRGPMIHKILYGQLTLTGSFYELTYTNNLGYIPIFFGFDGGASGTSFSGLIGLEQSPPSLRVNDNGDVTIRSSTASYGSIVILKDPFTVADIEDVSV